MPSSTQPMPICSTAAAWRVPSPGAGARKFKTGATPGGQGSLQVAGQLGLCSIAMPAISTGIFGFPVERAARVMLQAVKAHFEEDPTSSLETVRLVLIDSQAQSTFLEALENIIDSN